MTGAFLSLEFELPIVSGRGAAVGAGDVSVGEMNVTVDHLKGGVAEQLLEDAGIAIVGEELGGEGVAEAVGVDVGNAGALANPLEVPAEGAAVEVLVGEAAALVGEAE